MFLTGDEHRSARRYALSFPIQVLAIGTGDKLSRHGEVCDISSKGVRFTVGNTDGLQPGMLIQLEIALLDGKVLIQGSGRIVRVSTEDSTFAATFGRSELIRSSLGQGVR